MIRRYLNGETRLRKPQSLHGESIAMQGAVSYTHLNSFFLEGFYTRQKLQLLENAYENLNAIAMDKEDQGVHLFFAQGRDLAFQKGAFT